MDRIRQNPLPVLAAAGVLLACLVLAWFVRFLGSQPVEYALAPLSEVVLRLDELTPGYERDGITSDCQGYLTIHFSQTDVAENPTECFQVQYSIGGRTTIVLNAVWVYADPAGAEAAFLRFAELIPIANNIDMNIPDVPTALGERRIASTARITGGLSPVFVTNLFWKSGNAVVRLSVLDRNGFTPMESMLIPAKKIGLRLEAR